MECLIIKLTEKQVDFLRQGYPIRILESIECNDCANDINFELQIEEERP